MNERKFGRHAAIGVRGVSAALVAMAILGFANASANALTVINPGFEDISGETPSGEFTFGPLNGWDLYEESVGLTDGGDGPTFFIGTLTPTDNVTPGTNEFFPDGAPEGDRVGIAFNFNGSGGTGEYGMVQTLTDVLEANTNYELSVQIGNIASGTATSTTFFPLNGFPGYRVDLLAGTTVLASDNNSLAGLIPEGEFMTTTVEFTTGDTHDDLDELLGIRLVNLNVVDNSVANPNDQDLEVDFDDVSLTATSVPEPTSAMVLLGTTIALIARRRSGSRAG